MSEGGDNTSTFVERSGEERKPQMSANGKSSTATAAGRVSPPSSKVTKDCVVKLTDIAAGFKRKFDEISEQKRKDRNEDGENQSEEPTMKRKRQNGENVGGGDDNVVDMDHDNVDNDAGGEGEEEDIADADEELEEADEDETENDESKKPAAEKSNVNGGGGGGGGGEGVKKRKNPGTAMASMRKLINMEDRSPLCLLGETESNMFPKTVELMNHKVSVIYDSRVHMWFKAEDFAKAVGFKNYKSAVEKYVNKDFVLPYPNVLDLSRARYGDAFRLYSVNNKTAFINEAGAVQLLLRSLICGNSQQQRQTATTATTTTTNNVSQTIEKQCVVTGNPDETVPTLAAAVAAAAFEEKGTNKHSVVKPRISADWIDYQLQPALIAFSNAARYGKTAKELRAENM
jgi:prophage antirepressor-like protein